MEYFYKFLIQDITKEEQELGVLGYTLEVFANSEAEAMHEALPIAGDNAILSVISKSVA